MILPYKSFTGIFPRTEPTLLPSGASQDALDCDFAKIALTGIQDWKPYQSAPDARSLFIHDKTGHLLYWTNCEADAYRSPIANDLYNRVYWTDGSGFYVRQIETGGSTVNPTGYLVGVYSPAETLLVTKDVDNFTVAKGATGGGFSAVAELPDGTQQTPVFLGANEAIVDTILKKTWKLPLGSFKIETVNVTTEASSTSTGEFTVYDAEGNAHVISVEADGRRYEVTESTSSDTGVVTRTKTQLSDDQYPDAGVGVASTVTEVTPEMAIIFQVSMGTQPPIWATIRNEYPKSTLPPEMEGVYAYWSIDPDDPTNVVITLYRDAASIEHRGYVFTYVNIFDEESAPSPALELDCLDDEEIPLQYPKPRMDTESFVISQWEVGGGFRAECLDSNGAVLTSKWLGSHTADVESSTRKEWVLPLGGFSCGGGGNLFITLLLDLSGSRRVNIKIGPSAGTSSVPPEAYGVTTWYEIEGSDVRIIMTRPESRTYVGFAPLKAVRIYRTATGSTDTNWLFVGEALINDTDQSFIDSKRTAELGEPLTTLKYAPSVEGVSGLTLMPNGVFAYFKGNEIYFTEPYLPYATRVDYPLVTSHDVVGMCAAEGGMYVTTKANPYFVSGMSPDSMGQQKVTSVQAGIHKGSLVNVGPMVAFACNDGIATARGLQVDMALSNTFVTREKWRALYGDKLDKMRLSVHDGNLLLWFTDRSPGVLIRLDSEPLSMTGIKHPIASAFVHPVADALYLGDGSQVYEFKGLSTSKPFMWWGNDNVTPQPTNFGAIQFVGTGGALTFTVYADGAAVHTETVTLTDTGRTIARLPSGFLARRWSVKVEGASGVKLNEMYLATSVLELQRV